MSVEKGHVEVNTVRGGVAYVQDQLKPALETVFKNADPEEWDELASEIVSRLRKVLLDPKAMGLSCIGAISVSETLLEIFSGEKGMEFLVSLPNNHLVLLDLIAAHPTGIRGDFLMGRFDLLAPSNKPKNIENPYNRLNVCIMRLRTRLETMNMKILRSGSDPGMYQLVKTPLSSS